MSQELILDTRKVLFKPGDTIELRVLGTGKKKIHSGYFRDWEKLAEKANIFDTNDKHNSYVVLNTIDPSAYARSPEAMQKPSDDPVSTANQNIIERRWLYVDLDPVRASGVASSDEEHELALAKAQYIALEMNNRLGWPMPIIADSGNGAHLLWSISIPNRTNAELAEGTRLIESVLGAFATMFNDERIKVDTKVDNAARISRLYGTVNRKGSNIPERPWRLSKIISVPEKILLVTKEKMEYLAELYNETVSSYHYPVQRTYGGLDVGEWLKKYNIGIFETKPSRDGGTVYVLEKCPWNEEHTNHSAYIIQFQSGAIVAKCHHNGCSGKSWYDLRRIYEPDETIAQVAEDTPQMEEPTLEPVAADVFELNSVGDLERLYVLHGHDLRYAKEIKAWYRWDGVKWSSELKDRSLALSAMRDVIDLLVQQSLDPTLDPDERETLKVYAKKKGSYKNIMDTICLAELDRRFAGNILEFDQDDYLLNTESGIMDLKEFQCMPNDPSRMMTKSVGYIYNPDAICPRFIKFLNEIFNEDEELIAYIQRLFGYCLTGSMREKSFYIFWGPVGDNGKTVLVTTMRNVLGDYAVTAEIDTFLQKNNNHSHTEDLAALRGARLITTAEPDEGTKFAIGRIKNWTGRNDLACRHIWGSMFTYSPTGKLIVETNNKPRIYERTDAAWDRIHLVPFQISIPNEKQNKDLDDILKEERPGVLNWALDGLREYYRLDDLHPTADMRTAANEYRSENDSAKLFFDDMCTVMEHCRISHKALYKAYRTYCESNGIPPMGVRRFKDAMEPLARKSNCVVKKMTTGVIWFGFTVTEPFPVEA